MEKHLAHARHINSLVYIWEEGKIPRTCAEHGAPGTCPGQSGCGSEVQTQVPPGLEQASAKLCF